MKKRKLTGICLAVCVMGAAVTACSAQGQAENGSPASTEGVQYTDGIAEEPGNDGEDGKAVSGIVDGTVSGQGTGDEAGSPAEPADGQGETEGGLPAELLKDSYLNGPDTCPYVTFVSDGPVTAQGGRFHLSAAEDGDLWRYDEFEILKRYMHGEWRQVPIITGMCGNTSYYDVPADEPEAMDIEWQWLYGELPPGIYCLEKNVFPGKVLDADYEDMDEKTIAMEEAKKHVCAPFAIHGEPDIQMEVWDVTPTGLKLQFTHMPGKARDITEYDFGSWYELEQYTEGEWKTLPVYAEAEYAWEDLAYSIPAEGSQVLEIDWEWLYGSLEDGTYRIHKNIYPEKDASRDLSMYTAFWVEKCREGEE